MMPCMHQDRTGPLQPVLLHSDSLGQLPGNDQNVIPKDLYVQLGEYTSRDHVVMCACFGHIFLNRQGLRRAPLK